MEFGEMIEYIESNSHLIRPMIQSCYDQVVYVLFYDKDKDLSFSGYIYSSTSNETICVVDLVHRIDSADHSEYSYYEDNDIFTEEYIVAGYNDTRDSFDYYNVSYNSLFRCDEID